jgi:uncharacterized protein YjiS (DUF1127 family)
MATIETIYRTSPERASVSSRSRAYDISQSHAAKSSVTAILEWIEHKLEKRRSRRALLEMSDDQLKDIGLSRSDAHGEALRPFWD